MVFAHMDQLGFIVRKIEASGLIRLERQGGVPERALPAQAVLLCTEQGDLPGVISNKSHHATSPEEKYQVVPYAKLAVDAGFASKAEAEAAGVRIGTPVVVPAARSSSWPAAASRAPPWTTARAARRCSRWPQARQGKPGPTLHLVWSVQEEHNLRGVLPAATALAPDIAICHRHDARLRHARGGRSRATSRSAAGPAMSLFSFHGRGTLNGVIPHPALVRLMDDAAAGGRPAACSARRTRACSPTSATSSSWAR